MKVAIHNVHLDLGAGRRGTDMGPSAIHVAGLVPKLTALGHTIEAIQSIGFQSNETLDPEFPKARFLNEIYQTCQALHDNVLADLQKGRTPVVLGGDHSQAIGTISALSRHYRESNQEVGVLWVDAHADMNTPDTSPSGNIHGMPLATLLGHGPKELVAISGDRAALKPEHVVVFGAREIDPTETALVKELGIRVYTMQEIDRRGMSTCVAEAVDLLAQGTAGIHLSFDLDGVDPQYAPGVGTPVFGGLSLRESHLLCESIAATQKLLGLEVVELNPILDQANRTGELAVWLIQSALGKTII